jgi:ankyrin repeat protein
MAFTINQKVIFAVRGKNLELLKERISEGGDVNHQDPEHGSPLVAAINNEDEAILQYLIENGANVNAENSHGIVPLETALHHSSDEVVRKLSWLGAKLNSRARPHWKERLEACLKNYKSLKQDKKQLVFAPASLILTNYFLPLNEAL